MKARKVWGWILFLAGIILLLGAVVLLIWGRMNPERFAMLLQGRSAFEQLIATHWPELMGAGFVVALGGLLLLITGNNIEKTNEIDRFEEEFREGKMEPNREEAYEHHDVAISFDGDEAPRKGADRAPFEGQNGPDWPVTTAVPLDDRKAEAQPDFSAEPGMNAPNFPAPYAQNEFVYADENLPDGAEESTQAPRNPLDIPQPVFGHSHMAPDAGETPAQTLFDEESPKEPANSGDSAPSDDRPEHPPETPVEKKIALHGEPDLFR